MVKSWTPEIEWSFYDDFLRNLTWYLYFYWIFNEILRLHDFFMLKIKINLIL